jgi:hypothetical protein
MQGTATLDITALINSSTYTRVSLNDNELNVAFGFKITTSGDAIEVDFNQFEAGAFATSPMASAGAARNADVLTYVTLNNFKDSAGSAYAEVAENLTAAQKVSASQESDVIGTGGGGGSVVIRLSSDSKVKYYDLTTISSGVAYTPSAVTPVKVAMSYGGTAGFTAASGSISASSAFDGTFGLSTIGIGVPFNSAAQLYGTIRNVRIYNAALSNAQLQAMTA